MKIEKSKYKREEDRVMERGRNRRKRSREETYRKRAIEKGISIWLYRRKVEYTKQNGAEMPKNGENNSAEIGVNSGIVPILKSN